MFKSVELKAWSALYERFGVAPHNNRLCQFLLALADDIDHERMKTLLNLIDDERDDALELASFDADW